MKVYINAIVQYQKCKNQPFAQLEVIVNTTCDINSAILMEQNKKVLDSSTVALNSAILKY